MARPTRAPAHYATELAQVAGIVRKTAVDGRLSKVQQTKVRQLVGELTNLLVAAQAGDLPNDHKPR